MQITIKATVPPDWIKYVTKQSDLFVSTACGYYLYGVGRTSKGWIAREMYHEEFKGWGNSDLRLRDALALESNEVPQGYHLLDAQVAAAAFKIGCEKYGVNWWADCDPNKIDYVIQTALFRKLKYG